MENITTTLIVLSKIQLNPLNPRRIFNERALVSDIGERGLDVALQLRGFTGRKTYETMRGDRRTKALRILEKEQPEAFAEHFADGVPCVVHMDISDEEAIEITNDHGQSLSLSNEFEIYLTVEGYYRMGLSERQALMKIQTLLDHVLPIKGKAALKLAELKESLDKATKANRDERSKAYFDQYASARRGIMQRYTRIHKNAAVVRDAMEYKWLQTMPDGYENELPMLTDKDLQQLSKVFVDEATEGVFDSSGKPLITRSYPGDRWNDAWKDLITSKAIDGKTDGPRKSKGRKEILKPLQDGQIESGMMANVIRHHAADKEIDASCIHKADQQLAIVQIVQLVDLSLWESCVEMYETYKEEQRTAPVETETE